MSQQNMENIVNDIFKKYHINSRAPIQILKILEQLNIEYEQNNFLKPHENISGYIYKNDERCVILVNLSNSEIQKRFTIAHELGHYFLHLKNCNGEFVDWYGKTYDNIEKEANSFAMALLMPEKLLKELHSQLNRPLIKILAKKFNVSEITMKIRLIDLELPYET